MAKKTKAQIVNVIEALEQAAKTGKLIPIAIQRAKIADNKLKTQFVPAIAEAMGVTCKDIKNMSRSAPKNGQKARVRDAFTTVASEMRQAMRQETHAADKSGRPLKRRTKYHGPRTPRRDAA